MNAADFHDGLKTEVNRALVGQDEAIRLCAIALMVGGHILLEGVPGVGKTLLAKCVARAMQLGYGRVQFTPDLLPADIVGTSVYDLATREFRTRRGPIFTNILLADEINRAPAKVQSALLEAMEERGVTLEGAQEALPDPFMVLATQNPVEYEGTYPLPEAQQDRFLFRAQLDYPSPEDETEVLRRWDSGIQLRDPAAAGVRPVLTLSDLEIARVEIASMTVTPEVLTYILALARATREEPQVSLGISPRGAVALLMASKAAAAISGRDYVTPDDVKSVLRPAFRHRILVRPEAEVSGHSAETVIETVEAQVTPPR